MKDEQFRILVDHVMKSIRDTEQQIGHNIYVKVATGTTNDGKSYIRVEDDELGEEFEPLPVLNRDEDYIVRSMFSREEWRRSAMSDWAQAAVITLEEKGLLCEGDYNPDAIYITNAGKAYVEGRRLPRIVIPPYNE